MLCGGKYRHVDTDFRDDSDRCHRVRREARNGSNQIHLPRIRLCKAKNLFLNILLVGTQFVNVLQALFEFGGLLMGYGSVHSGLDFLYGMLAAPIHERCNIKRFPGVFQNIADDGT